MKKGLAAIIILYAISTISWLVSCFTTDPSLLFSIVAFLISLAILIGLIRKKELGRYFAVLISWLAIIGAIILFGIMIWIVTQDDPGDELTKTIAIRGFAELIIILMNILIIRYLGKIEIKRLFK